MNPLLGTVAITGATSWIKLKLLRTGGGGMIESGTEVAMTTAQWMPTLITRETLVHNIFNLIYIDISAAEAQTHHRYARTSAEVEVEESTKMGILGAKEEMTRGLLVGGVTVPGRDFFL